MNALLSPKTVPPDIAPPLLLPMPEGIATPAPTIPPMPPSPLSVSALMFTFTFPAAATLLTAELADDFSEFYSCNGSLAVPPMICCPIASMTIPFLSLVCADMVNNEVKDERMGRESLP